MNSSNDALVGKVRSQARRLLVQQQQLQVALAYGKLCEQRILQLCAGHPLPVTAAMVQAPMADLVPASCASSCPLSNADERSVAGKHVELDCCEPIHASSTCKSRSTCKSMSSTCSRRAAEEAVVVPAHSCAAVSNPRAGRGDRAASTVALRAECAQLKHALNAVQEDAERQRRANEREIMELRKALDTAGRMPNRTYTATAHQRPGRATNEQGQREGRRNMQVSKQALTSSALT